MKKALIISAFLVSLLLLLVVWRLWQRASKPAVTAGAAPATVVELDTVVRKKMDFQLDQVGNVEAQQNVDILSRTAGPITELRVREGDHVVKGQLLVRIDPSTAQAKVFKARSSLATARANYYEQLSQRELTSVQARSSVAIAGADVNAARADLQKTRKVYVATQKQGRTTVAEARAKLVGTQAQQRQAQVDFDKAKSQYQRYLELQAQGFASNADVQDSYREVLAKHAARDLQKANVVAAQRAVSNAESQADKDTPSAYSDIQTSRFTEVSKQASLEEAQAGTSKTQAFEQRLASYQALVDSAVAELKTAELELEQTVLRSPVDGFVTARKLAEGQVTSVGNAILTVQSGGEVWVVAPLAQELYSLVERGHECDISIDGLRNKVFKGRVASKDPAVDTASRQFNIRLKLYDPKGMVRPGMFARVHLELGSRDEQLTVPTAALQDRNDKQQTATVYRVLNQQVQRANVRFLWAGPKDTILLSGLAVGDRVVVQTAAALAEGQKVQVQSP